MKVKKKKESYKQFQSLSFEFVADKGHKNCNFDFDNTNAEIRHTHTCAHASTYFHVDKHTCSHPIILIPTHTRARSGAHTEHKRISTAVN